MWRSRKKFTVLLEADCALLSVQVRSLICKVRPVQELTELLERHAQGCTPVLCIKFWPEAFRDSLAWVDSALYCQVKEQSLSLASSESEKMILVLDFWCPKQEQL
jgi:hypothetical protein